MAGRREVGGLSWVGVVRLIPLKAIAWLELAARKEQGAKVDAKDVRKHSSTMCRAFHNCSRPPHALRSTGRWRRHDAFVVAVAADTAIDAKVLQLGDVAVAERVGRIAQK